MHVELAHNFIEHFQKIPKAFLTSLALYFLSHEFEINVFYVLFLSQSIKKLLCVFGLILALKLEIVDLTDDEDQLEIDLFVVEVSYLLHKGAKG
jgi:predicted outer membrane lipoprotein